MSTTSKKKTFFQVPATFGQKDSNFLNSEEQEVRSGKIICSEAHWERKSGLADGSLRCEEPDVEICVLVEFGDARLDLRQHHAGVQLRADDLQGLGHVEANVRNLKPGKTFVQNLRVYLNFAQQQPSFTPEFDEMIQSEAFRQTQIEKLNGTHKFLGEVP